MPTPTWDRLDPTRRDAVLRAAGEEFTAHGFSSGSLNVIARSAGIAKGSLFQYFHDKSDLYAHMADLAAVRIRAAMEERIAEIDWDPDFFAGMEHLLVAWQGHFLANPLDLAVTEATNLESERSARPVVRATVNRHYLEVLGPLLERARASGALRDGVDLEALTAHLMLILPNVALAPHNAGLDPLLGLGSPHPEERRSALARLAASLRSAYGR